MASFWKSIFNDFVEFWFWVTFCQIRINESYFEFFLIRCHHWLFSKSDSEWIFVRKLILRKLYIIEVRQWGIFVYIIIICSRKLIVCNVFGSKFDSERLFVEIRFESKFFWVILVEKWFDTQYFFFVFWFWVNFCDNSDSLFVLLDSKSPFVERLFFSKFLSKFDSAWFLYRNLFLTMSIFFFEN